MDIRPCFYRISVKALICDHDGRFLLAREDNGGWDLPGGGLDHGEEPHDGLRREVFEETGLRIEDIAEGPSFFVTAINRKNEPFANVIYRAALQDLNFVPSAECQELRFFLPEEARVVPLFPNVSAFVELYVEHLRAEE